MPLPLFVLIVTLELLVAITIWAPTSLPGRFARRPQFGILVWLGSFTTALLLGGIAGVLAIWMAVAEYLTLTEVALADTNLPQVILASLAPWMLLALAGASMVVANLRLQNRGESAAELTAKLAVAARDYVWQGRRVLVTPLPIPVAGVMRGQIMISEPVDSLPQPLRDAVLWHELAHIRLGHGALRTITRLVARLMPRVSAATTMRAEVDRLSELAADAWAARRCDPAALAAARSLFQEVLPTSVR